MNQAVVLMMVLGACGAVEASEPARRPNVVLILADDLGWSDTTLFGTTKFYRTPNLERLAKRGMTFSRAYSASPLCSPTRSAVLTGLSPARTGITTPGCHRPQVVLEPEVAKSAPPGKKVLMPSSVTRLKTEYRTLAEALKDAGYATAHMGKWHLGREPYSPLEQGFDLDLPHWPGPGPVGSYVAPWRFDHFAPDPDEPHQHIEDRMAKEAAQWMAKHRDGPFYLNYWMFSVHAPFDAKPDLVEKYRKIANPQDPQRCPTYAAMVESMDDAVGTLLDTVDRLGIADNTVIIFTSDNGGNCYSEVDGTVPTSNAPLRGGKGNLWEGGTRVPCVVVWPGVVEPESRSEALVQSEDYYPTLLDALGLKPEPGQTLDGQSILPALKGEPFVHEPTFQFFPHETGVPDWLPPAVSVHRGDWKLVRIFHGGEKGSHRYLLFNLKADPGERKDLSESKPELVKELDGLISGFLKETDAVVPVPNPRFDPQQYHPEEEGKAKPRKARQKKKASGPRNNPGGLPELQGWKARGCEAKVTGGVVTLTATNLTPFLGVGAGRTEGEAKLRFRMKSLADGEGKVEWRPGGKAQAGRESRAASAFYQATAGDWKEYAVKVPAPPGEPGILRLYVPALDGAVQVDWIELKTGGQTRRWDF